MNNNMKKQYLTVALTMLTMTTMAQETYESATLASQDLNGTARYVGMGGAMEALGADISTIGTNPAGVGMFRKSWLGMSGGISFQKAQYDNGGKGTLGSDLNNKGVTNADLNQFGFVYSTQVGRDRWLNFGFNYSKNRNFNQIVTAINSLDEASLNKMSYIRLASLKADPKSWTATKLSDSRWGYVSMLDDLNYSVVNDEYSGWWDNNSYYADDYSDATAYAGRREESGYISNFDFNISGNIDNRLYLGLTIGVKDVRYRSTYTYDEALSVLPTMNLGEVYGMTDERRVTGNGYDVKLGIIARPIEDSPFRIGAYVHSPTWYILNCRGNMSTAATLPYEEYMENNQIKYSAILPSATPIGTPKVVMLENTNDYNYDYKYKIETPWKFGLSLGHTIDNIFAIGATYEYADYSTVKNKINDGTYTDSYYYSDWYDDYVFSDYYDSFAHDGQMDRNTENTLKGVHTLKLGAEIKPVPEVAIRMGYNWVSPMYSSDGSKDYTIDANPDYGSPGAYYSTYDYTNWKDTHRVTFGLGFKLSPKVNLDLSYQYATQKGDFHPFQSVKNVNTYIINDNGTSEISGASPVTNIGTVTKVKNDRHQINCTLGIRI